MAASSSLHKIVYQSREHSVRIWAERSAAFLYCEGKNEYEKYLLCTDGFYRRIDRKLLNTQLMLLRKRNVRKTLKLLTEAVILGGEKDNVTVALIINERGGEG